MQLTIDYLIIDWGTTNFRAFAMSENHKLVCSKEASLGLLHITDGDFAKALYKTLEDWLGYFQHLPIYLAGMVGSMKGWVNVDYVPTSANREQIARNAYQFELPWGTKNNQSPIATIFPGIKHQNKQNEYDVMRGEEVQLLGLIEQAKQASFSAILPGTHSKHVRVKQNEIVEFSSFLTGEIYSVLFKHSLLGKGLSQKKTINEAAFVKGVNESNGPFTNRIFLSWTHRLFSNLDESNVDDYLSGMLIGYELRAFEDSFSYLIGGNSLCERYQMAAQTLNIETKSVSGNECFLKGMISLIEELNHGCK